MSCKEDEHAELVAEVAELLEEVEAMRRRFVNAWMHHDAYSEQLITLSEWAEARGTTRFASYDLRRRHDDFPLPLGSFHGAMVFNRQDLDLWLDNRRRGA